jgi:hypothetical protein
MKIHMTNSTKVVEPDEMFGETPVYNGSMAEFEELLHWQFPLSIGRSQEERDWRKKTFLFGEFIAKLSQHQESKKKNGACFMQGALVDGVKQRTIPNVRELSFMVLDIDSGQPMDEVRQELIAQDLFAILYTTYSHGTTQTKIKKTEIITKLKLEQGEEITNAHVKFYLQHHKRYDKRILETCTFLKEEHVEGGVMVFVEHAPMEKYRIVLPLYEQFVIAEQCGGNERAAREKWKRLYVGLASQLGASYDRSCVDISRLFFWPTHKPGGDYRVEIILGEMLDLSKVQEIDPKELENSNPFTEAGIDEGDTVPLENGWLKSWMRGKYVHFAAGDFFSNYYDQRNRNGDKITTECPFDAGHSEAGLSTDQGFFCVDGDGDEKAFAAHCQHDSCSQYRRLNFVDKAVSEFGLTEEDLEQFVPEGIELADDVTVEEGEARNGSARIQHLIDRLTPETANKVSHVLDLIATADVEDVVAEPWLRQIVKNTNSSLPTVRKGYRDEQRKRKRAMEEAEATKSGTIWIPARGDFKEIVSQSLKAIEKKNSPPFIFNDHGTLITLHEDRKSKRLIRETLPKDRLSWALNKCVTFYDQGESGRRSTEPPLAVVNNIYATPRHLLPVPFHERTARHPILSKDGWLITKQGFDPTSGVYVHMPDLRLLPVSAKPDDGELDEAWDWFFAPDGLLGDFPFKDDGDDEALEKDEGHLLGQSTKAHVLALFLLPIIRGIIDGPVPAFVINKPMPGAGSGLFANVWNRTINGVDCPTYAPPKRSGSDELDKLIFGKLLSNPDDPMFFDNVERLESNSLASAITSGNYAGRKLGVSEVVTMDVRHVWLFSGNNIDPSDELARRMIPIYIMPDVARPELRSDFRHSDLPGWCMEYRPELIWALCTLIQNWVAKGMPDGKKTIGSFDRWARVTGGILEAAGIDGFLGNLSAWRNLSTSANQQDDEGMEALLRHTGEMVWFKAGELFDKLYDDVDHRMIVHVPIRGRDEQGLRTSFGTFLRNRKGKVFEIGGQSFKLNVRGGKPLEYRFTPIKTPASGMELALEAAE